MWIVYYFRPNHISVFSKEFVKNSVTFVLHTRLHCLGQLIFLKKILQFVKHYFTNNFMINFSSEFFIIVLCARARASYKLYCICENKKKIKRRKNMFRKKFYSDATTWKQLIIKWNLCPEIKSGTCGLTYQDALTILG